MNTINIHADYKKYVLLNSTRIRENIEWSQIYNFNANDTVNPRVQLIGDSICCGYKDVIRERLADKANISLWGTSRGISNPDYLRELDFILDYMPPDIIFFNNGIHCIVTPIDEYTTALTQVISFMQEKLHQTMIFLVLSTPSRDPEKTEKIKELNLALTSIGNKFGLSVVDLFTPMDNLNREEFWRDDYHFQPEAIQIQSDILTHHILACLTNCASGISLKQLGTEMGPDGAIV